METGYEISRGPVVTRVAEGAITFATGVKYAPVIQGTAVNQVKAATQNATTVLGFVRKPTTKDSIADGDTVGVMLAPAIILQKVDASCNVNDYLSVGAIVNELAPLTIATDSSANIVASYAKVVARAKHKLDASGNAYVSVGGQ